MNEGIRVSTNVAGGPRVVVDEWGPIVDFSPSGAAPLPGEYIDQSTIDASTKISNITNNTNLTAAYKKRTAKSVYLDLTTAFGGGVAEPTNATMGAALALPAGTSIMVEDAWSTADNSPQVDCRIAVRFDGDEEWSYMRAGSFLSGWPFKTVYATWPAQAARRMKLKVWEDDPLSRVDIPGS